ncbi:hypothetical protein GCM10027047_06250 [Rhodococcus aerolatus]
MTSDRSRVLDALPDAIVVLDRDLLVVDANATYTGLLGLELPDLVGRPVASLLEPRDEDPDAGDRMLAGYAEVLRTGSTTVLGVARYDFPDPDDPSRLAVRYWSVEVSPLTGPDGALEALVHRARDVTSVHLQLVRAIELHHELGGDEPPAELVELVRGPVHTSQLAAALQQEVAQLRQAMASRAGIEQAKGILMGQRGLDPDGAFALLVQLSQDTNRKLRDVAAAVVGSVTGEASPACSPAPAATQDA